MAFFKRVIDHLFNQILVDGLANSRWFQRFAVWSHTSFKELSEKGKGGASILDSQLSQWSQAAKESSSKFRADFAAELKKVQEQMQQQEAGKLKK